MKKNLNANSKHIAGTTGASSSEALNFKPFDPVTWTLIGERRFKEEELEMVEIKATIVSKYGWPLVVQFNVEQVEDQDRPEHFWLDLELDCGLEIGDEIYVRDLMVRIYKNDEGQEVVILTYDPTPTEEEEWEHWEAFDVDALQ